jgi:hypothetical protein
VEFVKVQAKEERRMSKFESSLPRAKEESEHYKTDIGSLLDHLGQLVEIYGQEQTIDWGHVGELGHIREQLVNLVCFIGPLKEGDVETVLEEIRSAE